MWWIFLLIPAALLIFIAVIIIRALNFKPKAQPKVNENEENFDKDRAITALQELIKMQNGLVQRRFP